MMWTIVEAIAAITLGVLGLLLAIELALALIGLIKETLTELEWIHPKQISDDGDDEDDESWEEYNGGL